MINYGAYWQQFIYSKVMEILEVEAYHGLLETLLHVVKQQNLKIDHFWNVKNSRTNKHCRKWQLEWFYGKPIFKYFNCRIVFWIICWWKDKQLEEAVLVNNL